MAITEKLITQPRAQVPEHGVSSAMPPRVRAFADDGHLSEYSASPTMPLRVGAFVDDVHRMHGLRRVGIDTETAIMHSCDLDKYLHEQQQENKNPILKERYERLASTKTACVRVLEQLKLVPELATIFAGKRPNAVIEGDTYAEHAARCAGLVVKQFGVHDPSTFALTYLHDVFDDIDKTDPQLMHRVTQIVHAEMAGLMKEGVVNRDIVSGLKSFAEFDTHSKKVARKIANDLRETDLRLGQEFTPEKFQRLRTKISKEYTAQITSVSKNADGSYVVSEEENKEKYPSIYTALHDAANADGLGLSVIVAHLAAMTDHALHPAAKNPEESEEETLANRQENNLDALAILLPIFQGVGDVYARYAQNAACEAFFPKAFATLNSVARQNSNEYEGRYYDEQAKAYSQLIRGKMKRAILRSTKKHPRFISDAEMEARKYALKKGENIELLRPDEIYVPGTEHADHRQSGTVPDFSMDVKTASSILFKALSKSAQEPCQLHDELKAMLDEGQWGSHEFWERFLADVPDLLRTTIVADSDLAKDLKWNAENFMKRLSYDPTEGRFAKNHANTIYTSEKDSPERRKKECVEQGKEGFLHIVARVPHMQLTHPDGEMKAIVPNNVEVHVGGGHDYRKNNGSTPANHGLYKMGLQSSLRSSLADEEQVTLALEACAQQVTKVGRQFMEMTYGVEGLEAAKRHFDGAHAQACIGGSVFKRA